MKKALKHHKNKHNDKNRNPIKKEREVPEQPKPCCPNQEAIEAKNLWLMKQLLKQPQYELQAGKWSLIVPRSFRRTYRRHMGHFMDYFNRKKYGK